MNNKKIALALALGLIFMPISSKAAEAFERLSGNNRYATAKAIANYGWTSSEYVIIAQGENFPDALCSVPLAKKYNAPILLTTKDTLTKEVEDEIKRLAPSNIIIVGGEGSISIKVEEYIKDTFKNATLERIGGKDRFETSTKIAEKLNFNGEIALTSSVSYADALSMAPIAAVKEIPILLTPKDKLSSYTSSYLKGKTVSKAYIIGGTGVVSENLKNGIENSHRIYGENRFATNVAILKEFGSGLGKENIFAALGNGPKGNEFADALSGAALAAKMNAPMILIDKVLPKEIKNYVISDLGKEAKLFALGGEAVVSDKIINEIRTNIGQGEETGGGNSGDVTKLEVTSVYLKADNGTKLNGSIDAGTVLINIPQDFKGKYTEIVISTSNDIKIAKVSGTTIDEATINRLYGNDRKNIDLLLYLKEQGFDSEGDGLSPASIKMLDGMSIILTDINGNSVDYKLNIN